MVKTIHHRIQVYKCFAVIDMGSKHENRDCKKININNENNARFMQMCYTYCQKCLWIIVENKDIHMSL